jgi:hypothetical protein
MKTILQRTLVAIATTAVVGVMFASTEASARRGGGAGLRAGGGFKAAGIRNAGLRAGIRGGGLRAAAIARRPDFGRPGRPDFGRPGRPSVGWSGNWGNYGWGWGAAAAGVAVGAAATSAAYYNYCSDPYYRSYYNCDGYWGGGGYYNPYYYPRY